MDYKKLYYNEGYWTTKIQLELYRSLESYMQREGLSRTQLARKLGVTKSYITQVLSGDFNHRLSSLVKLALAIGLVPEIRFKNVDDLVLKLTENIRTVTWEIEIPQNGERDKVAIEESSQPLSHVG
ncbi:MAG: helix-turn-helix transcriptional regulator [Bacteroidota bacterium]